MAHEDFKDFPRRTAFDKVSHDKADNIAEIPKFYGCQRRLASMVHGKKYSGGAVTRAAESAWLRSD